MKFRHLSIAALLTVTTYASQAQKVQIRGGVNLANVSVTNDGRVNESNQLSSFQVGFVADVPLVKNLLSLQPGVLYTGKGAKVQNGTEGQNGYYRQSFNPRYIEVPLNLVVKAPFSKQGGFFFGAGPYVAVGVGGKVKTDGQVLGAEYDFERDIRFSNDDPTTFTEEEGTGLGVVRRFDYGINGTAGFETKNLALGVNYGLGLAKLQSGTNSSDNANNKNRVWSFTLGFKL